MLAQTSTQQLRIRQGEQSDETRTEEQRRKDFRDYEVHVRGAYGQSFTNVEATGVQVDQLRVPSHVQDLLYTGLAMTALKVGDQEIRPRTEAVTLAGQIVHPLGNVLANYPELVHSKWWRDQSEDMFLSAFYGQPTTLGVFVGDKWFGVATWRIGLRKKFQLQCPFAGLALLSQCATGQQKNLAAALVTVAQIPVVAPEMTAVKIAVVGSRMGLESGLWHESFNNFVETHHPGSKISYYDPLEQPSVEERPSLVVEHIRAKAPTDLKVDVLIDDAQVGETYAPLQFPLAKAFSLKKRGEFNFCIAERRFFSSVTPALFCSSMTMCKCQMCKSLSFVAQRYGGWPVWEKLRGYMANLGTVCDPSSYLRLQTETALATRRLKTGMALTKSELRLARPLDPPITEQQLYYDVLTMRGSVYAYLNEWERMVFRRGEPLDFVVLDSPETLTEVGMVPVIITKASLTLPGYRLKKTYGPYRWFERVIRVPEASRRLKF